MAEMGSVSRFFVNLSASRRSARRVEWIRGSAKIPRAAVCLEVGCGSGALAARFVEGLGPAKYIATDIDPRQVEEARKLLARRFPTGMPPALELRIADMLRLPFPDGSFDVVLAFMALHHSGSNHHDPTAVPRVLAEVDRVLRPRGAFLYIEFLHKELIRSWLSQRGYSLEQVQRGWRVESVMARKPADAS